MFLDVISLVAGGGGDKERRKDVDVMGMLALRSSEVSGN